MQRSVLDVHVVGNVVLQLVVLAVLAHEHVPSGGGESFSVEFVPEDERPAGSLGRSLRGNRFRQNHGTEKKRHHYALHKSPSRTDGTAHYAQARIKNVQQERQRELDLRDGQRRTLGWLGFG